MSRSMKLRHLVGLLLICAVIMDIWTQIYLNQINQIDDKIQVLLLLHNVFLLVFTMVYWRRLLQPTPDVLSVVPVNELN